MSDNRKRKTDKKKLAVRIVCLFLAILMVGGVAYSIFASLSYKVSAAGNTYIRVGLAYGSSAKSVVTLSSDTGFELGTVDSGYNFYPFLSISDKTVRISCASSDVTMSTSVAVQKSDKTLIYGRADGNFYIRPKNAGNGNYITYNSNQYGGLFHIYRSGSAITLTNAVELEEYVKGVIPYEIYNTWPKETVKAFAVIVRSYTLGSLTRHSSNGFNVCATSHCQVYKGRRLVNDNVEAAVNETKGQVVKYNGKLISTYYSDSTGGCTASAHDTWGSGSEYGYLKAIATPWEKFSEHSSGEWTVEYTPSELYKQLYNKGYFKTSGGKVSSVKITQYCENSSYVYSATVTSASGTTVTISRADKIRSAFGLKSANFVVGKAGTTVTRTEYTVSDEATTVTTNLPLSVVVNGGKSTTDETKLTVATASGIKTADKGDSVKVQTAYGVFDSATTNTTKTNKYSSTIDKMINGKKVAKTVSVYLSGTSGSFVFNGRGWGHGVGFSQWGMYDLANMGADYKQIINAYLSGVTIGTN